MVTLALIAFGALATVAAAPDTLDAETVLIDIDDAENAEEIAERLDELRTRRIDLNAASADDLLELPFLSPADAHAIVNHRRSRGPYAAVDSLRGVTGIDDITVRRLRPFVTVGNEARPPAVRRIDIVNRWARKLERSDGFRRDSSGYLGDPNVLQTRISLRAGRVSARATLDKDAGEMMAPRFDFLAGHVVLEDVGWMRRLVVGDFSPRFGQGMLLSVPGARRSGAAARTTTTLRPYASATESGHFRGLGVEVAPAAWIAATAFASRRRLDAGVDTTGVALSISRRSTGLHRTQSEIDGRAALTETAVGAAVRIELGVFSLAAAYHSAAERLKEVPASTYARVSITAGAVVGGIHLAAEFLPGAGISTSADVRTGRRGRIGLAVRSAYGDAYLPTSLLAAASSGRIEQRTDVTVRGLHRLSKTTALEYAFEHAYRPPTGNRRPFSSVASSADMLLRVDPRPWLTLSARATDRRRQDPAACTDVRCMNDIRRRSLRVQADYRHSRTFECRIRAETVRAERADTSGYGFLLYEEVQIRPAPAVRIIGRLAVFDVDFHEARVYTYENDLRYAFSSPSFTGRGRRLFVLVRWDAAGRLTLEGKWSTTTYEDVRSIGSGRDEIEGRRLREIRVQLQLRI